MKLLSKELVSREYCEQLQQDLSRATVCRFLVAYISGEGLGSIGRDLLTRVLREPRSFGVGSLSCSCGYEPLVELQRQLGNSTGPRLKYFMDPMIKSEDEPKELALFHSKLVYLMQEREQKSVVYLGSHNWTRRALGPGGPRNAEASLRLEMPLVPEHLEGIGTSLASEVNRHLLQAYNLPACLTATPDNEPAFWQWFETGCKRAPNAPLQEVTVLLAVRKPDGRSPSPRQWEALTGAGIYLQVLEEAEGDKVWESNDRILLLVWNSPAELQAGRQPLILDCRVTTKKAGPKSRRRGTNQSTAPVAGFQAVLFDGNQMASETEGQRTGRAFLSIWSGRGVEYYDFEFPTPDTDSSQVDQSVTPLYQFHLEVQHVVFPAEGDCPENPEMIWTPVSFAVAESRDSARYNRIEGYQVSREVELAILECLRVSLLIDLETEVAKVLPVSAFDETRAGKRVSSHPLHDTFLGSAAHKERVEFFRSATPGALVADLDEVNLTDSPGRLVEWGGVPLHRVQRVFTMPLDRLGSVWMATAHQFSSRRRENERS